ncbi:MAG: hypothetical protein JW734_03030 [Candidatus Omnitrophica bacterium]|nr:hypothetical protein [Candidatus Omnitrophota bacterium]
MKEVASRKVKIFKIKNRRGYAAACFNHLTEGRTPYQAYARMRKALKRSGLSLKEVDAARASRLLTTLR